MNSSCQFPSLIFWVGWERQEGIKEETPQKTKKSNPSTPLIVDIIPFKRKFETISDTPFLPLPLAEGQEIELECTKLHVFSNNGLWLL